MNCKSSFFAFDRFLGLDCPLLAFNFVLERVQVSRKQYLVSPASLVPVFVDKGLVYLQVLCFC
jgi:hypothetical protein